MSQFNLPTETVELPSKGLLYPESSPLSSGTIEMKYMTAKEEDILSNANYLSNGTAIDKLLKSLIIDKTIKYNDILLGDKNAIMLAARILSYGKDYTIEYRGEETVVDLTKLTPKYLSNDLIVDKKNEFKFTLPKSKNELVFRLLTHGDEIAINQEVQGLQKIDKNSNPEGSTRLKYIIISVNGITDRPEVRKFVDNFLLAQDARALRKYYQEISPDVKFKADVNTSAGVSEGVDVPIGLGFFWPDYSV